MPSSLLVIINTPARATHSLLAREALREAARAMQLPLRIETLLESGAQDPLAPEELAAAPLVLCVGEAPAQRLAGKAAHVVTLAAVLADPAARLRGQGGKSRISARAGAAINTNGKGGFFHERTGVEGNQNEKEGADSARRSKNRRQASLHAPSRATFSRKTGADGGQPNAASQQQRQQ